MPVSKLPWLTIVLGTYIIISASFTKQLLDFVKTYIGTQGFSVLVSLILIVLTLLLFIFKIRKKGRLINTLVFIIILIIAIILILQLEIPEEKMHFVEFGTLGWIAGRDLIKRNKKTKRAILAFVICILVGILQESLQLLLPYRYFQWRDILFNNLGSTLGLILYLLS